MWRSCLALGLLLLCGGPSRGAATGGRGAACACGRCFRQREPGPLRAAASGLRGRVPQHGRAAGDPLHGYGSIAVAMVQWTGPALQAVAVNWSLIDDAASAERFAAAIEAAPRVAVRRWDLDQRRDRLCDGHVGAGALSRGSDRSSMFRATARTTAGAPRRMRVTTAVREGVTINGLPILTLEPELDVYYRQSVIGGARRIRHRGDTAMRSSPRRCATS